MIAAHRRRHGWIFTLLALLLPLLIAWAMTARPEPVFARQPVAGIGTDAEGRR